MYANQGLKLNTSIQSSQQNVTSVAKKMHSVYVEIRI